jgi:hypothetical protein
MLTATAVNAQEIVIGAGYSDFSNNASHDRGIVSLEYHHTPFYTHNRFGIGLAASGAVDSHGDLFLGAGFVGIYQLKNSWFIEGSVLPGYYHASDSNNNLGSDFEIRSLLGLGYTFQSGNRLSLAATHKSNAGTGNRNPGVNSILVRLHRQF